VAEVALRTKIPTKLLEALEAEQYERLPNGIFGRGYVRAAAEAVGLDGRELSTAYREETEPVELRAVPAMAGMQPETSPRLYLAADPDPAPRFPLRTVALIVAAAACVFLVVWWLSQDRTASPVANDAPAPAITAPTKAADHGGVSARTAGAVGTSGTLARRAGSAGVVELTIAATRPCWVTLTADGERVVYRLLARGDRASTRFHDRAVLRTGDAGALTLTMNGREARPIGAPGEVRTIEITPANYASVLR
jgi:cytoskeleton protein RodZ